MKLAIKSALVFGIFILSMTSVPVAADNNLLSPKAPTLPTAAELAKRLEIDKKRAMPPQKVEVEFVWDYKKNFPLKVRLFELSPSAIEAIGFDRNDKEFMSKYPVIRELQSTDHGQYLSTFSGRSTTLLMVVENFTDQPVYFFASPHGTYPAELNLGMKFLCLCNGHAYRAEPKNFYTRVISLRLTQQTRSSFFRIHHDIFLADRKMIEKTVEEDL